MDNKSSDKSEKHFIDYKEASIYKILDNHTNEFIEPLKESYREKVKIIEDAQDMSTQEKLDTIGQVEAKYLSALG